MRNRKLKQKNVCSGLQISDKSTMNAEDWLEKGIALRDSCDDVGAIIAFTKAIELNDSYSKAYMHRGMIYHLAGNHDVAIHDLNKVTQIDPNHVVAFFALGVSYSRLGDQNKANAAIKKSIELDPNPSDGFLYTRRGLAYNMLQEYTKAIKDFSTAIKLGDTPYKSRGIAYLMLEMTDEAIADFNKEIEINQKNDASVYHLRGLAYLGLGGYHNAIMDFDTAIKIDPQARSYYNRGIAYDNLGDRQMAIESLKLAASLGSEEAIEWLQSKGINE